MPVFVSLRGEENTGHILLSIYMLSFSEVHQLLRLPILVEHFIEHRQIDHDISFLAFLKLHYGKIEIDDDYQRDQQLPFRTAEFGACNISSFWECPVVIEVQQQDFLFKQQFHLFNEDGEPLLSSADIFQPPRFC
ncbi:MAG: hypothetical protein HC867_10325 [Bacteroidia bacterium]|nr:hypothetical protein [Bacteroidia bacterium]